MVSRYVAFFVYCRNGISLISCKVTSSWFPEYLFDFLQFKGPFEQGTWNELLNSSFFYGAPTFIFTDWRTREIESRGPVDATKRQENMKAF
ncbi:uncharacterized protein LOC9648834 isoform X2 [Selaginella moellendorffii]|uniref:uncharacterized protein LOC9648834 isoform X2 n=1 Tax=Selaginella moellendorffii TaxID=88036 RepID=UPI000D1C48C1|nr:uncharacterized protein LOC9648834 isoform X2 [Selaginella moellendorffii]|eukprot:XP_024537127.1 uncharacterized protein LOC9648834 isoform X2 [Selaginella moellendorffii]